MPWILKNYVSVLVRVLNLFKSVDLLKLQSSFGEGSPYRKLYNSSFLSFAKSKNYAFRLLLVTCNLRQVKNDLYNFLSPIFFLLKILVQNVLHLKINCTKFFLGHNLMWKQLFYDKWFFGILFDVFLLFQIFLTPNFFKKKIWNQFFFN